MTIYPKAVLDLLPDDHSASGTAAQRNLIVLHCTAGPTASSAINTFKASVAPNRVSSHFVIDVDGTVYQLVDVERTAWHASEVNSRSVGIEHAAIPGTQPATDAQYQASAELVAWLGGILKVSFDDAHVQPHSVASPRDGHVLCCQGAVDPDRVISMAAVIASGT